MRLSGITITGVVVTAILFACTGDDAKLTRGDGVTNPELDASSEAASNADGAVDRCANAAPPACSGDGASLIACKKEDGTTAPIPCPFGCVAARCQALIPSGAARDVDYTAATKDLVIADNATFNTDTGEIKDGTTVVRALDVANVDPASGIGFTKREQNDPLYPPLGIYYVRSLVVPSGKTITFSGSASAVLIVGSDFTLDGVISVRGVCANNTPGPGGYAGSAKGKGGGPSGGESDPNCAGSGGGNGTAGGMSGAATLGGNPHCSGIAGGVASPSVLVGEKLRGGGGGGAGFWLAPLATPVFSSGAGGGAIQLAVNGALRIAGTIDAGGCGGIHHRSKEQTGDQVQGAGGGGAGGTILIEAASIVIRPAGRVVANGGGGGGGFKSENGSVDQPASQNGVDGTMDDTCAAGGMGDLVPNGGAGGCAASAGAPVSGVAALVDPAGVFSGPSGGGGGGGQVAFRTRSKATLEPGAIASPTAQDGTVTFK